MIGKATHHLKKDYTFNSDLWIYDLHNQPKATAPIIYFITRMEFYLFEVLRSSSSFTKKSSGQMSVFHWSPSSLVAASVNTDFFQEEKSWSKGRRFETINPSLLNPIQRWTKRSIQNNYQQQEYWKFKALKNLEKLYFLNYYS